MKAKIIMSIVNYYLSFLLFLDRNVPFFDDFSFYMTFQKYAIRLWSYDSSICKHEVTFFLGEDEDGLYIYICETCGKVLFKEEEVSDAKGK